MQWLKEIRSQKGMAQKEIAAKIPMTRTAYSNIEVGNRRPSVKVAKQIGEILGFDWTRFYEDIPGTGKACPQSSSGAAQAPTGGEENRNSA